MAKSRSGSLKEQIHDVLNVSGPDDRVGRLFSQFSIILIFASTIAVILESVDDIYRRWGGTLDGIQAGTTLAFTIEYLLRVWSCTVEPRFAHPLFGRLKMILSPLAVFDLIALLAFYLTDSHVSSLLALRSLRLLRLLLAFKLARYSKTVRGFMRVFRSKRNELQVALFLNLMLVIFASTLLYVIEHEHQPQVFSSIPATMWWAAITLTTVGYGDAYPVTPLGKMMTVVIAFFGIGLFALPTGILASGFMQEAMAAMVRGGKCPTCGRVASKAEPGP